MAPQNVAVEHHKDYDVTGPPLELECLDDRSRHRETKIASWSECCWSEKAARKGAGPVVETLAQDWSSMDREMQKECAVVLAFQHNNTPA